MYAESLETDHTHSGSDDQHYSSVRERGLSAKVTVTDLTSPFFHDKTTVRYHLRAETISWLINRAIINKHFD